MPRLSLHPQDNRKDRPHLILQDQIPDNQANETCPTVTQGLERDVKAEMGVIALLVRLYAFFYAQLKTEMDTLYGLDFPACHGTAKVKSRLMSSGPYQVSRNNKEQVRRQDALEVKSILLPKSGWVVLWPGALRDRVFKTGRTISSFRNAARGLLASKWDYEVHAFIIGWELTRAVNTAPVVLSLRALDLETAYLDRTPP